MMLVGLLPVVGFVIGYLTADLQAHRAAGRLAMHLMGQGIADATSPTVAEISAGSSISEALRQRAGLR